MTALKMSGLKPNLSCGADRSRTARSGGAAQRRKGADV